MSKAIRVAIANQKGGVGKTTTAVNLGAELAAMGLRVLLIDMDHQGNATTGCGVGEDTVEDSTYTVLRNARQGVQYALRSIASNFWLLPATLDLAAAEWELAALPARETLLRRALDVGDTMGRFDYILFDCPPGFTLAAQNALAAADWVLVPVSAELYPMRGLGQLQRSVERMQDAVNPDLHIGRILITMMDRRNTIAREVETALRAKYGVTVLSTVIPRNVKLTEAPGAGIAIREYAPDSTGAVAYRLLAEELTHAQ